MPYDLGLAAPSESQAPPEARSGTPHSPSFGEIVSSLAIWLGCESQRLSGGPLVLLGIWGLEQTAQAGIQAFDSLSSALPTKSPQPPIYKSLWGR